MAWNKTQTTLRAGERWLGPAVAQLKPQVVDVLKYECERCQTTTVIFVTNQNEKIRAWCCGRWLTYEEGKPAQRQRVLTRLFRE